MSQELEVWSASMVYYQLMMDMKGVAGKDSKDELNCAAFAAWYGPPGNCMRLTLIL